MAGRQMRHLLKELEANALPEKDADGSSGDDDEDVPGKSINPFAFLCETDGEDDSGEVQVTGASSDDDQVGSYVTERTSQTVTARGKKHMTKKKKSKKKTKKSQVVGCTSSSEEDIDQVLEELNMSTNRENAGASNGERNPEEERRLRESTLLHIEPGLLQGSSELRRIFGAEVTRGLSGDDTEDRTAGLAGASRRIRRLAARGLIRQQGTLRKGLLINPRNTWPPYTKGDLVLTHVGTSPNGKAVYSYVPSRSYDAIQSQYRNVQSSYNPRNLMGLLQLYPYHIDSLLSIGDLYRSTGDGQYADEMLEMCIYALEQGWPSSMMNLINSPTGIEIPYEGYNVSLFVALMRHVQTLGKRGLHRTALEICKLVLSLNSEDPCGALFTIDYFAIRCKKYSFLRELADCHDQGGAATMPNIVYSLALAKYHEEEEGRKGTDCDIANTSQIGDNESSLSANDLMAKAVMLHPAVLVLMQKKLNKDLNLTLSDDWIRVLHSSPFSLYDEGYINNPSLQKLVDIFVERNHLLWKTDPIQKFLLYAAEKVSSLANASVDMQREDLPLGLTIDDWSNVRAQAFPTDKGDQYRHLRVDDFSDSIAQLPPEEIEGALQQGGDLDDVELDQLVQQLEGGRLDDLGDAGAFAAFIRSLLPWVHAGQQPNYEDRDDQHNN